jgi:hypothetical protein
LRTIAALGRPRDQDPFIRGHQGAPPRGDRGKKMGLSADRVRNITSAGHCMISKFSVGENILTGRHLTESEFAKMKGIRRSAPT